MIIKGVRPKVYIAVVGTPDSGKSTFIRAFVKAITFRDVSVDSFCNEQRLDMTIRSAQLVLRDNKLPYDIVLLDCVGHIFDLEEEAVSVLSKASLVIRITNRRQGEVVAYSEKYRNPKDWDNRFNELCCDKKTIDVYSHSDRNEWNEYDSENDTSRFSFIYDKIVESVTGDMLVDPVETAIRVIKAANDIPGKHIMMCSYGKDSVALLSLLKMCESFRSTDIVYANSGFDLDGMSKEFRKSVDDFFGIKTKEFPMLDDGWNYENHTTAEITECKARHITEYIKNGGYKVCFTGIRRDEEGNRAKEKFFSPRKEDGTYDNLKAQVEVFGRESEGVGEYSHLRVAALLDLTELDVWEIVRSLGLPVCKEYYSVNGKRFRSLGDKQITTPIDSTAHTMDEIVEEVKLSLVPERACRAKQDNSVKFGMEKFRAKGFF